MFLLLPDVVAEEQEVVGENLWKGRWQGGGQEERWRGGYGSHGGEERWRRGGEGDVVDREGGAGGGEYVRVGVELERRRCRTGGGVRWR